MSGRPKSFFRGRITRGRIYQVKSRFSNRTPAQFEPNALTSALDRMNTYVDLTLTNPTKAEFRYPKDIHPYDPEPRGLLSAREVVAKWLSGYGAKADPNFIWLTSSTSEAYSYLIKLLCNPGDAIAVPSPSYPLFEALLSLEGVYSHSYYLRWLEGNWRVDFDSLEKVIENVKAVVAIHPNNPTGSFLSDQEARQLLALCSRKDIPLITDEVFLPFAFSGQKRSLGSFSADIPLFVLGGISKPLGLPQMKLGWISLLGKQPAGYAERLDWIADTYLSVGATIQRTLAEVFRSFDGMTAQIQSRIRENHQWLMSQSRSTLQYLEGEGGWACIFKLSDEVDEEKLTLDLLQRERILLQPGYFFDLPFPAALVGSLLVPTQWWKGAWLKLVGRLGIG